MILFLTAITALVPAGPARAESPEELVRWIYSSLLQPGPAESRGLAYVTAPGQRDQFLSGRLADFFDANDSHGDDLMTACVDFAFDIPGQDYDAEEIVRTLRVTSAEESGRKEVTATFTSFGEPAAITYVFVANDGFWRIDDIAGPGWRVSEIPCEPKSGAAAAGIRGPGYCYQSGSDTLRLDVAGDGRALFELESWQANGHSCHASGQARPMEGGWVFEAAEPEGACRMELLVTPDGGIRLTDRDWVCKTARCGARAVLDGLTFARESQVECSRLRPDRGGVSSAG